MNKFVLGDKVRVVCNSERRPELSYLNMIGVVEGFCSKDCVVRFNNGITSYIYESDLELSTI